MAESGLHKKYKKNFDLTGFANLRSIRTGKLPETLEFVLGRLDEKSILSFFDEIGFHYESISAVEPEYGMVVEEITNELGVLVPIPDKLAITLEDENGTTNVWFVNDCALEERFRITQRDNSSFYDECVLPNAKDYWRAFMLSNFGREYAMKLETEFIFEAYFRAASVNKHNRQGIGEKLYSYADRQFEKLDSLMPRFAKTDIDDEYNR